MKSSFIKKAFNKSADRYDASCELQLKTGNKLIDLAKDYCSVSHSILDAGCGTGLITKKLASALDYQIFYAIDMADKLLERAKEKLLPLNINVELADYNHIQHINILFDMIYANLSLHWSSNFEGTLAMMRNKLDDRGILAFSIPLSDTFKEVQYFCSTNKFEELSSIEKSIKNAGLTIINNQTQMITFGFDNILTALKSIKSFGGDYVADEYRNEHSFTKLRKHAKSNTAVNLSYHIGYFIVKK